jgi:hypothetical protein
MMLIRVEECVLDSVTMSSASTEAERLLQKSGIRKSDSAKAANVFTSSFKTRAARGHIVTA